MKIYAFADEASSFVDGQIKALQENGLHGLEARTVDRVNITEISDFKAREIKAKMDAAGFQVWTIGSPVGKLDIEKGDFYQHTEKFRRALEVANILGSENIRLFSFFVPKDKNPDDYENEVIDRLGKFVEIAKGSGVTLCHENEKGIYGDVASRCVTIHKALPELKAIFDPANFVQCGQDTIEAWDMLKGYVKYMHIKDALPDGSVVPAGKGAGNVPYLLGEYKKQNGECLTLEPHLKVFHGLAALENEDEKSVVGEVYSYPSNEAAFKAASDALKILL